jgi:hypothetical protein
LNVFGMLFASAVIADQPLSYWRLNETANTSSGLLAAADAMLRFNGVYASGSTDDVPGPSPSAGFPGFEIANTGVEFTNGMPNSYVSLPVLRLNTNTVTITAWIYPMGTPANAAGLFFCRPNGDASGFNFGTGGQLGYTWNQNNSDTWGWNSGLVPTLQQWSFVSLVISPSSAVIYLYNTNGFQSATNAIPHTSEAFNTYSLIGGDSADGGNGARTFNGIMDEVAIFTNSLTAVQQCFCRRANDFDFHRIGLAPPSPAMAVQQWRWFHQYTWGQHECAGIQRRSHQHRLVRTGGDEQLCRGNLRSRHLDRHS